MPGCARHTNPSASPPDSQIVPLQNSYPTRKINPGHRTANLRIGREQGVFPSMFNVGRSMFEVLIPSPASLRAIIPYPVFAAQLPFPPNPAAPAPDRSFVANLSRVLLLPELRPLAALAPSDPAQGRRFAAGERAKAPPPLAPRLVTPPARYTPTLRHPQEPPPRLRAACRPAPGRA